MQSKALRIFFVVLLALLALALIGFTVYEIVVQGVLDVSHIIRALLILIGILMATGVLNDVMQSLA